MVRRIVSSSLTETIASCDEFVVRSVGGVLFLRVVKICFVRLLTFQINVPLLLDF